MVEVDGEGEGEDDTTMMATTPPTPPPGEAARWGFSIASGTSFVKQLCLTLIPPYPILLLLLQHQHCLPIFPIEGV